MDIECSGSESSTFSTLNPKPNPKPLTEGLSHDPTCTSNRHYLHLKALNRGLGCGEGLGLRSLKRRILKLSQRLNPKPGS